MGSTIAKGGYGKEAQKLSGGADRFLDFLNDELIPFMETEFRVSPQDRTIVGISYGGLFSSYALISRPTLFQKLIIISPSLWWDRRFVFRTVNKKVATFKDIHAKVFFSAGSLEKGEGKVADMGKDIKDFASEIESQHFPGFEAKVWIAPNEIHHSVFCGAASRGLRYLFEIPSKKK
jgi:predicted alpha/beta superfamily hydrolase